MPYTQPILLGIALAYVTTIPAGSLWASEPEERRGDPGYVNEIWQVLAVVPGGATAEAVAESARRSAPTVAAAEAELAATVARSRQTLSRYVPRIVAQASYLRKNPVVFDFSGGASTVGALNEGGLQVGACPGGVGANCVLDSAGLPVQAVAASPFVIPVNNYTLQLDLSVPISDYVLALAPAKRAAEADEAAAQLRRESELETVGTNARIAYYDWLRARAQVALARRSLASAEARLVDARAGAKAGTIADADVSGVEALVAASTSAVAQAESFLRLAEQNLVVTARWQGPLEVGEDVTQPVPDLSAFGSLDALIAHGQAHRPEVRALRAAMVALTHVMRGLSINALPRLDGVANVTHANPNQAFFPPTSVWNTSWFLGVALRWQLDSLLFARAQVREMEATARALEAQHTAAMRGIELEVRSAWEDWQRATAALAQSDAALRASEAAYRQRVVLFRGGEATSTEVTEAEVQRHNASLRAVSARIEQRIACARMRRAAGLAQVGTAGEGTTGLRSKP